MLHIFGVLCFDFDNSEVIVISSDEAEESITDVRSSTSLNVGYNVLFAVTNFINYRQVIMTSKILPRPTSRLFELDLPMGCMSFKIFFLFYFLKHHLIYY